MRKSILLGIFMLLACSLSAHSKVFCEIVERNQFNKKVKIIIDFGQVREKSVNQQTLVDESGNTIQFNSKIDALNYMTTLGWEFVQAYTVMTGSNGDVKSETHWILSKEVTEKQNAYEGITTKEVYDKSQNK